MSLLALLWATGPVWAHVTFGDGSQVMAVPDDKPEELKDVTIQVVGQEQLGEELLVENNTGETMEIYDADGKPMLRIGPEGVDAKRPEGTEANQWSTESTDAEGEWVHKSDKQTWGWFDRRLQTEGMAVPEEVRQAQEPADLGEWSIPVRLGEVDTEVRGTFHYEPAPKGAYVARFTSEPKSSGIRVQLTQGYGKSPAALFMQNQSGDPVTILGRSGEPAIRIGPKEVQINTNSPVGREADSSSGSDASAGDAPSDGTEEAPEWKTVSGGSNFVWQDPRLRPPDGQQSQPPDDAGAGNGQQEVAQWEIPMEVAGEEEQLTGVIDWKPFKATAAAATDGSKDQGSSADWTSIRGVATVGAVTVVPAAVVLAVLLVPGFIYRRRRK